SSSSARRDRPRAAISGAAVVWSRYASMVHLSATLGGEISGPSGHVRIARALDLHQQAPDVHRALEAELACADRDCLTVDDQVPRAALGISAPDAEHTVHRPGFIQQ